MPTYPSKARRLLRSNLAVVKHRQPFTIQLKYATGENKQPINLGVDTGYTNIGLSASTEKAELFASEVRIRQDVSAALASRRAARISRRARKTRYRAPRFLNRVRTKCKGWIAPSHKHRIQSHVAQVDRVCKILPISKIIVENGSFDIQKINNPEITSTGYQQGEQYGLANLRTYILERDGCRCRNCLGKSGDKHLELHHIESRKIGGNAPNNLIILCHTCHQSFHKGLIKLKLKRGNAFRNASFMNITRHKIIEQIQQSHPDIEICTTFGYLTRILRSKYGLEKSHCSDAFCIAGNLKATRLDKYFYQFQVKRHYRQLHKMNFLKGGKRRVHKLPFLVHGFRLFDYVQFKGQYGFILSRRQTGYFRVGSLDYEYIGQGLSYKKLKLITKARSWLIELRRK